MTRSLVVACLVLATALIVQHADAVDSLRRLSKAHKASRAHAEAQVDASTTVSLQRVAIDPRVFDLEESVARPTNFLQWEVGQRYVYRFTSKAAHMSTPLPAPDRVNPQIALEDLGLFPFAVLEGTLTLSSICMLDDRTVTFEATITRTRVDCGEDSLRPNSTCPHLYGVGRALTANPFWFTMNPRGEIISMDFSVADDEEVSGIKRNMVHELALTMPEKNENAALFARYQRRGATNFATRYRIRPFTRRSAFDSAIDGLIVRKERALSRPSRADREIGTEPAVYHRFTWVYMVIGGEVDARAGAAAVPTRLSALEQTQVDPLILAQRNASSVGSLYILSRLELNLRNVLPGVDNTTDLRKFIQVPTNETVMVNITGNVANQTVWVNGTQQICTVPLKPRAPDAPAPTGPELKHYEPTPALSFLETAASATSAVNHLEVVPESMTLENAQDDLHAALYEESALRAWM